MCGSNMASPSITLPATLTLRARWFSLLEFAVGVFVVVGHNIFRVLPNEVPILFILGWISLRLRNGGWKYAGLGRPKSWWKTVALALLAAAILLLGSELVVEPLAHRIWPEPEHESPDSHPLLHVSASCASGCIARRRTGSSRGSGPASSPRQRELSVVRPGNGRLARFACQDATRRGHRYSQARLGVGSASKHADEHGSFSPILP